jgi:chromosomal replication initiator protein
MEREKIWSQTLNALQGKFSKQIFETWFQTANLESLQEGKVKIGVPNRFFGDWLKDHYQDVLIETLNGLLQRNDVEITFGVKMEKQENLFREKVLKEEGKPERRTWVGAALNPRYTFNTIVVGSSNQFAHAATQAVAENPARAYNPLFIYGGVGLGKTHLLNAIGNHALNHKRLTKIVYVSSEQFTNEVINSIRYDRMGDFRNRYRNIDMLLVDDIQFIAGKERTQEEFFHTFNTLYESQKQIVITSDLFPKEMPTIEERLRSRFEWGLIADIQPPDLETKIAILKRKAETEKMPLNDEVALFLASNIQTNIRELEGSLIRLGAFSSLTGQEVTIELAKTVLRDTLIGKGKVVSVEEIQKAVAEQFQIKVSDMKSKKRTKNLVYPRQIAMYICREITPLSFPEIGRNFGGRDHTTVMHSCRIIGESKEKDVQLRKTLELLTKKLKEGR